MASLSEKISLLANPAPAYLDPEDDGNFETDAHIRKSPSSNEVLFTNSELRSKAAVLLDDCDPAFVGKKTSRKSLDKIFHADSGDDIEFDDDVDSDDDDGDEDEKQSDDDEDLEDFKRSLNQQIPGDGESEEDEGSIKSATSAEDEDEIADTTEDMVNQFSNFDVTSEMEKGAAVKEQLEIINRLCETRIRLQKLLAVSHTFPQKDSWLTVKATGGKEMADFMNKASVAAETTLNSCLDFQLEYFNRINDNQETKPLSDEEIPSDTDEEMEKSKEKKQIKSKKLSKVSKRKLKSQEYAEMLSKHLKDLLPYRNSVLQTWDEKTKLSSGRITQKSFSAFENSVIKQIEQVLQDKNRLIKRTQLKRTLYRVMGKSEFSENKKEDTESNEPESKQDMLLRDYDPEIYDDDDFYRQFLRDVIESKSVGIDPVSLRKQMEIQNVRNKIKRKVDTKASKGRKIRYDVDPKVVGYAVKEPTPTDSARDKILKNLCGGNC